LRVVGSGTEISPDLLTPGQGEGPGHRLISLIIIDQGTQQGVHLASGGDVLDELLAGCGTAAEPMV
jgi:hypothetical protein